ncbi:LPS O-antigen length regulator Wzz(fepE) [Scandinavium sp. V105_16]|uniref:LPS O-antigen length regulator Wzz(FepE) n=1 Tax=Scandinavium lactucae TaxID=3095028 RepID=A0AAJ2VUH0_9ENTR|nr:MULTISPECIES: LPS O-antigen length regulator Wzz(fepE) [unclassified Scandinavium]MDX6020485.1 LPS O-antigen length regulator Wzz(fepE) [Scandinavium sp. V105_16]MDX6031963.1 LPS O-antigen length regulator Wzz(fepE) [Scandinavium sp. V105_12]MDX6039839.1 LPS O-antigen length regulator Wzz(fepE) [Scandinavium sp. V105_6]MDX6051428.1 LPS O-antigen length regulator Wzz(fepE) [Scandinavium sp. V105_1]
MSAPEIIPTSMPYPTLPNKELDLLLLLEHLLKAKKRIMTITLVFAVTGLMMVCLMPQKWTSQAIVTAPEPAQLAPLHPVLATMQALGVDVKKTPADVFNYFIKEYSSRSLFQNWVMTSPSVLKGLVDENTDAEQMQKAIVKMAENLKVQNNLDTKHPDNTPYQSWTLSYTGKDPEKAQQLLNDYTQFAIIRVRTELLDTLKHQLSFKINVEKEKLALAIDDLNNQRDTKIQRLKYALKIADAAGIKKPVYGEGLSAKDDPDYSITLGADGLAAKLNVEKSLSDVATINPDLRNREYKIAQLTRLTIPNAQFMPFKYQLSPSLPVKHDGPGKLLIVLMMSAIGFMLANASVLLRQALQARN